MSSDNGLEESICLKCQQLAICNYISFDNDETAICKACSEDEFSSRKRCPRCHKLKQCGHLSLYDGDTSVCQECQETEKDETRGVLRQWSGHLYWRPCG